MLNNNYTYYKLTYPKHIIMVKKGNFYISLDNDALIMSNIFNYKIKETNNIIRIGFPVNALNKIIIKLESLNLNYLVVAHEITSNKEFENNTYDKHLNLVINNKIYVNRINEIHKKLSDNINNPNIKETIIEIESILCKINY